MEISLCRLMLVILFNLLGIALLMVSQNVSPIVEQLAAKKAVLREGSESADNFAKPPVPMTLSIYMFDLKNKEEVKEGKKPRVEERGPYVFKMTSEKVMKWTEKGVVYQTKKTFRLFSGNLEDEITTLHPLYITMASRTKVPTLFHTGPVGDFLFKGILVGEDEDGEHRIGYFTGKNGSSELPILASTGENGLEDLNKIIEYNAEKELKCEAVKGTNGERFSPFSKPPGKLTFFNPLLCRPWDLHYGGPSNVEGLECARYAAGREFFSRTLNSKLDECLEKDVEQAGIQGVFSAQYCQDSDFPPPILLSLPHFFNADSDLQNHVAGMKPSEDKHQFYMDVYPKTGFVVDMKVRVQVNFRLKKSEEEKELKEDVYPVFWQEMSLASEDRVTATDKLKSKVETPEKISFWLTLSIGILSLIIAELLLLKSMCPSKSSDDDDTNYRVTYDVRNNRSHVYA